MGRQPPAKRPAAAPHKSQARTLSRSLAPQIVGTAGRMAGGRYDWRDGTANEPTIESSVTRIRCLLETHYGNGWAALSLRAMTGAACLVDGSGWPSGVVLAVEKQSMPAGKATPDCAERVHRLAVTPTALGLSKQPRETARRSGQRSNVSPSVVPQ